MPVTPFVFAGDARFLPKATHPTTLLAELDRIVVRSGDIKGYRYQSKHIFEGIDGGIGIGPFKDLIQRPVPEQPDEHKDGGATGSW